jgi:putative DNA primase/helicase
MHEATMSFRDTVHGSLGNAPEHIEPGRFHRFSTNGKRGDTAGWCKLFDDTNGGVFGCMRQGISAAWTAVDRRRLTAAERAEFVRQAQAAAREREWQQHAAWADNAKRIASLWERCLAVREGDPVHRYLCRRLAIDAFDAPPCLRLHPALDYWHAGERIGTFAGMVATLTGPDGRTVALHRTYLTDDGYKADVPIVKKLTQAAGPLGGASIRLASPSGGSIGVAEGLESALAASLASGVPTVAAYCANALAGFQWPSGVQRLVIFADADKAGREAADTLRARALRAWLRCNVMTPTDDGADWCDVWAQRGQGAAA